MYVGVQKILNDIVDVVLVLYIAYKASDIVDDGVINSSSFFGQKLAPAFPHNAFVLIASNIQL